MRDGLTNDDCSTILYERLRALPSDLEDFIDLLLTSVDPIYWTRLANTFIAALRAPSAMNLMHYYFLDQDNPLRDDEDPVHKWAKIEIQNKASQTQRRLNGRFEGLLEPSTTNICDRTSVDFLHRTLRDFLEQGRIRRRLKTWAEKEDEALLCVSRAFVLESNLHERTSSIDGLTCALNCMEQAVSEVGFSKLCSDILEEVGGICERTGTVYQKHCQGSFIFRVAISIGQDDYVHHRLSKADRNINVHAALNHAMGCSLGMTSILSSCLMVVYGEHGARPINPRCFHNALLTDASPWPLIVQLLLDAGAYSHTVIHGTTAWERLLELLADIMDGETADRTWEVSDLILEKFPVDIQRYQSYWLHILRRRGCMSETSLTRTSKYFKRLFEIGLVVKDGPLDYSRVFMRRGRKEAFDLPHADHDAAMNLLVHLFRKGGDVAQCYRDLAPNGWLNTVVREVNYDPSYRILATIP